MIVTHEKLWDENGERLKSTTWINRTMISSKITFLANGKALEKCEDEFVKVYKLAHLNHFQSRMHGNKPFNPTNPRSKDIAS